MAGDSKCSKYGIRHNDIMDDLNDYNGLEDIVNKDAMDLADWAILYDKCSSGESESNKCLDKYRKDLLPTEPIRVFLPLCGKSPDLRWFYDRGNTVVGVEGVEKPVKEFFEINDDLPQFTVQTLDFGGSVYKTEDGRLTIYACDILNITSEQLGKFDLIFDYASYTAIHPRDTSRYVSIILSLLKEEFRVFVEFCHDAETDAVGLPNSLSFKTIKSQWGGHCDMRFLETNDISADWGVTSLFNTFMLLTPKKKKNEGGSCKPPSIGCCMESEGCCDYDNCCKKQNGRKKRKTK